MDILDIEEEYKFIDESFNRFMNYNEWYFNGDLRDLKKFFLSLNYDFIKYKNDKIEFYNKYNEYTLRINLESISEYKTLLKHSITLY